MNQLVICSLRFAEVRAFLIWEQRVVSSNPTAPTTYRKAASDSIAGGLCFFQIRRGQSPRLYLAILHGDGCGGVGCPGSNRAGLQASVLCAKLNRKEACVRGQSGLPGVQRYRISVFILNLQTDVLSAVRKGIQGDKPLRAILDVATAEEKTNFHGAAAV